jgi:hypothetical protein
LGKANANNRTGEGVRNCYRQRIRHKEYFSTTFNFSMDPYYLTGFSDGEAFLINSIYLIKDFKTGWWVIPTFTIELKKDAIILYKIKAYF